MEIVGVLSFWDKDAKIQRDKGFPAYTFSLQI